jgi:hypothetical protein
MRVEAAGGVGLVAATAHEYGVPVYSGGGFDSVTAKHDMVERAADRPITTTTVILHIGDHDPSGVSIFKNIEFELPYDEVVRVAITPTQAKRLGAPSAPAKRSAHSAKWSGPTWQLEALPPDELQDIVQQAILGYTDEDILAKTLRREKRERNKLVKQYKAG